MAENTFTRNALREARLIQMGIAAAELMNDDYWTPEMRAYFSSVAEVADKLTEEPEGSDSQ